MGNPYAFGHRSVETYRLQQRLIEKGFDLSPDGADYIYGRKTQAAVISIQQQLGVVATGTPDDAVLVYLGLKDAPAPKLPSILDIFRTTDALNKGEISMIPASVTDYIVNFLTSKINWFAGVMAGVIVTFLNTKFGLQLDAGTTTAITTLLVTVLTGGVMLLRTFFNNPKVVNGAKV